MWSSSPLPASGVYIYILGLGPCDSRPRRPKPCTDAQNACPDHSPSNGACCGADGGYPCCYPAQGGSSIEFNGRSCFAANDGETGGPKECGSADNSDAAKGLVVDAVVAVVAAVSIYAVALF